MNRKKLRYWLAKELVKRYDPEIRRLHRRLDHWTVKTHLQHQRLYQQLVDANLIEDERE